MSPPTRADASTYSTAGWLPTTAPVLRRTPGPTCQPEPTPTPARAPRSRHSGRASVRPCARCGQTGSGPRSRCWGSSSGCYQSPPCSGWRKACNAGSWTVSGCSGARACRSTRNSARTGALRRSPLPTPTPYATRYPTSSRSRRRCRGARGSSPGGRRNSRTSQRPRPSRWTRVHGHSQKGSTSPHHRTATTNPWWSSVEFSRASCSGRRATRSANTSSSTARPSRWSVF